MATHEIVSEDLIKRRLSHGPASATLERGGVILRSSSEQLIQDGSEPYTETDMFILLIAEEDKLGGFPNDNAYINDAREYRDNPAAQNLLISYQTRIINEAKNNNPGFKEYVENTKNELSSAKPHQIDFLQPAAELSRAIRYASYDFAIRKMFSEPEFELRMKGDNRTPGLDIEAYYKNVKVDYALHKQSERNLENLQKMSGGIHLLLNYLRQRPGKELSEDRIKDMLANDSFQELGAYLFVIHKMREAQNVFTNRDLASDSADIVLNTETAAAQSAFNSAEARAQRDYDLGVALLSSQRDQSILEARETLATAKLSAAAKSGKEIERIQNLANNELTSLYKDYPGLEEWLTLEPKGLEFVEVFMITDRENFDQSETTVARESVGQPEDVFAWLGCARCAAVDADFDIWRQQNQRRLDKDFQSRQPIVRTNAETPETTSHEQSDRGKRSLIRRSGAQKRLISDSTGSLPVQMNISAETDNVADEHGEMSQTDLALSCIKTVLAVNAFNRYSRILINSVENGDPSKVIIKKSTKEEIILALKTSNSPYKELVVDGNDRDNIFVDMLNTLDKNSPARERLLKIYKANDINQLIQASLHISEVTMFLTKYKLDESLIVANRSK